MGDTLNLMFRGGPARPGQVPFYKQGGRMVFDGQGGRQVDFGHAFDRERGYRVFFKFRDAPDANTWGPESLLEWCEFEPENDEQRQLQGIARQQARQCIALNRAWIAQGRPASGIPTEPMGSA